MWKRREKETERRREAKVEGMREGRKQRRGELIKCVKRSWRREGEKGEWKAKFDE